MGPNDTEEEKPKSQSEMFEEQRRDAFFGHLQGEEEKKEEDVKEEEKPEAEK